jgi:DNA-binding response OmpR family regulator
MDFLLVDPSPHVRLFYAINFNFRGVSTREAQTLDEAWQKTVDYPPDLIVFDPYLPAPEIGLELLNRLSGTPRTRRIPVLIITVDTIIVPVVMKFDNVQHALVKPMTVNTLLHAVDEILNVHIAPAKQIIAPVLPVFLPIL